MRLLIVAHLQNARESLRSHRLRSFLTMLGVTIGVASITAILALGDGAKQIIANQVDELGGTIAIVRPGAAESRFKDYVPRLNNQHQYATSTLTTQDLTDIRALPQVATAAPLMILTGAVTGEHEAPTGTPIVATSPELEQVNEIELHDGEFIREGLSVKTAVVGHQLSVDLFGTEQTIGKTVRIKGESHTIVGVLKQTDMPVNFNNINFDKAVIVTTESGLKLTGGAGQIQQINVRAKAVDQLNPMVVEMNKILLRNHLNNVDFNVLVGNEVSRPTNELFTIIAGATAAIAAISLIVGGVGIMNSMLVGVAERTREIGIRKALGASNRDIVAQFMIESLALSIGGGALGLVLGYVAAFGLSMLLPFSPVFSWATVGIAA